MRIRYFSTRWSLLWHPARSCQTSPLSASGTPLLTSADNVFGRTLKFKCLRGRREMHFAYGNQDTKHRGMVTLLSSACTSNLGSIWLHSWPLLSHYHVAGGGWEFRHNHAFEMSTGCDWFTPSSWANSNNQDEDACKDGEGNRRWLVFCEGVEFILMLYWPLAQIPAKKESYSSVRKGCSQFAFHRRDGRRGTTYHLDSSSPHVSRIFSAHSLETSPEPLKRGSSLSAKRDASQGQEKEAENNNPSLGSFCWSCFSVQILYPWTEQKESVPPPKRKKDNVPDGIQSGKTSSLIKVNYANCFLGFRNWQDPSQICPLYTVASPAQWQAAAIVATRLNTDYSEQQGGAWSSISHNRALHKRTVAD